MKQWTTIIRAIDPTDGEMKTWCGPNVPGICRGDAVHYCQTNGLGYCEVSGELIAEIPTAADGFTPLWNQRSDYDLPQLN